MNIAVLVQGIATLAWVGVVVAVIVVVLAASRSRPMRGGARLIIGLVVLAIVLSTVGAGMVFVAPQERAVVISVIAPNGLRAEALTPGIHWIVPFAESVVRYPISKQTYTMSIAQNEGQLEGDDSITARTSDGQQIYIDASVIYAINPANVTQVHIEWQDRFEDGVVRPVVRGVMRDVISQYGVEEVVTSKRNEMINAIASGISQKLADNGLMMTDFVLRNITFSEEYAASVEQKQIAEQQAQQAAFVVEQRRQEAEQARQVAKGQADAVVTKAQGDAEARIIEARAEAEALQLVAQVLQDNPDLLTYQYITKLSPNIQVMLLPSDSPFLLPFPEYGPQQTPTSVAPPAPTTP